MNINQNEYQSNLTYVFKKILKSVLISYILTLSAILIFSVIITYTDASEAFGDTMVKCATYISIFTGGLLSSVNTNKKGWLTGCITGFTYILILILAGFIKNGFSISPGLFSKVLYSLISGAAGGIAGINIKSR